MFRVVVTFILGAALLAIAVASAAALKVNDSTLQQWSLPVDIAVPPPIPTACQGKDAEHKASDDKCKKDGQDKSSGPSSSVRSLTTSAPAQVAPVAPLTRDGSPTTSSVVACQPFSLTYTGATAKDGNTTYSYTLMGGGATASGCKDISSVVLPVCFNPGLVGGGGLVISESHPLTPTGWGYQAGGSEASRLATWVASGKLVGSGPFNAVFSLTLRGTVIPLVPAIATVQLAGTDPAQAAGTVVVPAPVGCSVLPTTTGASGTPPDPTRSGNGHGSFIAGPNATSKTPPKLASTPSPIGTAEYGP